MRTTNKCAGRSNSIRTGSSDDNEESLVSARSCCAADQAGVVRLRTKHETSLIDHKKNAARMAASSLLHTQREEMQVVCQQLTISQLLKPQASPLHERCRHRIRQLH